jgi:tRNA threonylcarbamoyladenosine modification (KEOPS) complex  Pcc1 subunit
MKAKATIRLDFRSKKQIKVVMSSLSPEVENPSTKRSSASIWKKGTLLFLKIEARDTVALRAASNAYLRWVNSMRSILEVLEHGDP